MQVITWNMLGPERGCWGLARASMVLGAFGQDCKTPCLERLHMKGLNNASEGPARFPNKRGEPAMAQTRPPCPRLKPKLLDTELGHSLPCVPLPFEIHPNCPQTTHDIHSKAASSITYELWSKLLL